MRARMAATGVTATILIAAGPAHAAITLGSTPVPDSGCSTGDTFIVESAASGVPSYAAPSAGTITSWSFQAGAAAPTKLKLKVARNAGGGNWTIVGESSAQVPVASTLNTYPASIPVQAGDVIGFYTEGPGAGCAVHTANASDSYGIAGGDPAPTTTAAFLATNTVRLDISAQLEPAASPAPSSSPPPPPPVVSIALPADGATFSHHQSVSSSFTCSDPQGPGIASCTDQAGRPSGAALDTSTVGSHTFYASAFSRSGRTTTIRTTYTVLATPPQNITPPAIGGTAAAGRTLSCLPGAWSNDPTAYAYAWSRNGTPLGGATQSTYTVQTIDQGSTLTCTETASNEDGSASAASAGVLVPAPGGLCPPATGRWSGRRLGPVRLGASRRQVLRAFSHSSSRGRDYEDFVCLTPRGVRVGFGSPKLLRTLPRAERQRYRGRVVWISTANRRYAIRGVRPGVTLKFARRHLELAAPIRIGLNDWYLAPAGPVTAVLKVRHGVVQEVGVAVRALTRTRLAQAIFLGSFG